MLWSAGAVLAALLGTTRQAEAVAVLFLVALLQLAVNWWRLGKRTVLSVFGAFALLGVVPFVQSYASFSRDLLPLPHGRPPLDWRTAVPDYMVVLAAVLGAGANAAMRCFEGGSRRLRWITRKVAPALLALSFILVGFAKARSRQRPTFDQYTASLPIRGWVPAAVDSMCEMTIEDPGSATYVGPLSQVCTTDAIEVDQLSVYYVCQKGRCTVYAQVAGRRRWVVHAALEIRPEPVRWDANLGAWVLGDKFPFVLGDDDRRYWTLVELAPSLAPPTFWLWLSAGGVFVASLIQLLSLITFLWLRAGRQELRRATRRDVLEWLSAASVASISILLLSQAPMLAAACRGFVFVL